MSKGDAERLVAQHFRRDRLRRADDLAGHAEARGEGRMEAPEQVNMLRFLGRELEERPDAFILAAHIAPHLVEHEGEDEFLHETEDRKIFVPPYVIEGQPLGVAQPRDRAGPGQRLGQEGPGKIEPGAFGQHILQLPWGPIADGKHRGVIEVMIHVKKPSYLLAGGFHTR